MFKFIHSLPCVGIAHCMVLWTQFYHLSGKNNNVPHWPWYIPSWVFQQFLHSNYIVVFKATRGGVCGAHLQSYKPYVTVVIPSYVSDGIAPMTQFITSVKMSFTDAYGILKFTANFFEKEKAYLKYFVLIVGHPCFFILFEMLYWPLIGR